MVSNDRRNADDANRTRINTINVHSSYGDAALLNDARGRTINAIAIVLGSGEQVLIEALPTLGKSYGTIKAAARTGEPVLVLTGRGHVEQYEQIEKWCKEVGFDEDDYYTLPNFIRDCDTANGEHGEDWADIVQDWYNRGATPTEIHNASVRNRPPPCQRQDGECGYSEKWDFDPDEHDVLIGNYKHGHVPWVTAGRSVVLDEFPGRAYETCLDDGLEGAVTYFLKCHNGLPFDNYADLLEGRHDEQRRANALRWFQRRDLDSDGEQAFGSQNGHAAAPLAVYTLLAGATNNLGNGWERADLGDGSRVGLFNREQGRVWLLTPPEFTASRALLALDGTPTKRMWELALGTRLDHQHVLDDEERREYLTDGLGHRYVLTTDAVKPYHNPDNVSVEQDAALIEEITAQHGVKPDLFTSLTALDEYDAAGVLDGVGETGYYGNVLGSNEFANSRLGVVIGSNHFGDDYVERWAAYAGEAAEDNRDHETGEGFGADLSYGGFGDDVLQHMREQKTLQAAMRFGRDGNGAIIYVHSNTFPEWVPIAGKGSVDRTRRVGERNVIAACRDLARSRDEWTRADVEAHPCVDCSPRTVQRHLKRLTDDEGLLEREQEQVGRPYVYREATKGSLEDCNIHGRVSLPAEVADEIEGADPDRGRINTNTWSVGVGPGPDDPQSPGEALRPDDIVETFEDFRVRPGPNDPKSSGDALQPDDPEEAFGD